MLLKFSVIEYYNFGSIDLSKIENCLSFQLFLYGAVLQQILICKKMVSLGISSSLENVEMSVGELAFPQTASLLTILSNSKQLLLSPLSFQKEQFLSCSVFSGISCPAKFSKTNRFCCIKDCGSQDKSFGDTPS